MVLCRRQRRRQHRLVRGLREILHDACRGQWLLASAQYATSAANAAPSGVPSDGCGTALERASSGWSNKAWMSSRTSDGARRCPVCRSAAGAWASPRSPAAAAHRRLRPRSLRPAWPNSVAQFRFGQSGEIGQAAAEQRRQHRRRRARRGMAAPPSPARRALDRSRRVLRAQLGQQELRRRHRALRPAPRTPPCRAGARSCPGPRPRAGTGTWPSCRRRAGQAFSSARQAALRPAASPSKQNTISSVCRSSFCTCTGVVAVPSVATAYSTPDCASATTSM